MHLIQKTIDALPENQRLVITLHDQDELSTQEICNILGISETNQRVLLHRARAKVRQALENYFQVEH
jgi:RNA polymerase sigma-70 factor (ECF subfamily)